MGMSEREYHIKALENLLSHYKAREQCEGYYDSTLKDNVEALEYAISSIKTDEAYQIMYEGGEIFTKDDMVNMLEELKSEFEEYEPKWAENEDHVVASNRTWDDFDDIIQQKINDLKENSYADNKGKD